MIAANDNTPICVSTLEACLDRVALVIDRAGKNGAVYLPIYERLEAEIATRRVNDNKLASIRQRVKR